MKNRRTKQVARKGELRIRIASVVTALVIGVIIGMTSMPTKQLSADEAATVECADDASYCTVRRAYAEARNDSAGDQLKVRDVSYRCGLK
jgi:hypothetical protein